MRCNRQDGDAFPAWAVVPEDTPSGGGLVFCVGFEDILVVRALDGIVFVCVEARVAGIGFQIPQRLPHGLEAFSQTGIRFEIVEVCGCSVSEFQIEAKPI